MYTYYSSMILSVRDVGEQMPSLGASVGREIKAVAQYLQQGTADSVLDPSTVQNCWWRLGCCTVPDT